MACRKISNLNLNSNFLLVIQKAVVLPVYKSTTQRVEVNIKTGHQVLRRGLSKSPDDLISSHEFILHRNEAHQHSGDNFMTSC